MPQAFGDYTLLKKLGEGGMAEVYLAQAGEGEELIAVKRIRADLAKRKGLQRLFRREGSLALKLRHPVIVRTIEASAVDGIQYIAMEYIPGCDLSKLIPAMHDLPGGVMPVGHAVFIARQVCLGLHHAHELRDARGTPLNVVNRDVDPSNIRVSFDGQVKLLDFGIARALDALQSEIGKVKGKFSYMSPEQARCMTVDRRADIFSVGVVLHELLTGRRLFRGHSVANTIARIRHGETRPPSLSNPHVPESLDEIVARSLSKAREDRFSSGAEMAEALASIPLPTTVTEADLGRLVRQARPEQWRQSEYLRRSLAAGEPIDWDSLNQELPAREPDPHHQAELQEALVQPDERRTPTWVYWAFIPVAILFALSIYLVAT